MYIGYNCILYKHEVGILLILGHLASLIKFYIKKIIENNLKYRNYSACLQKLCISTLGLKLFLPCKYGKLGIFYISGISVQKGS